MLNRLLNVPLKLIPQPATAVSLSIVLNLFFSRYPDLKEQLAGLSGKIFEFEVTDLEESYFMSVDDQGIVSIHTYCDNIPHVTMSGSTPAFLSLLFQTTDPDSLFFSRALSLSGETDTGLHFKNILNNVEIDWEKELGALFPAPIARSLMKTAGQIKGAANAGREQVEKEIERWMEEQNLPSKEKFEGFQKELQALEQETRQLEGRISRLTKRRTLNQQNVAPATTAKND